MKSLQSVLNLFAQSLRVDNPLTRAEQYGDPDEIADARDWLENNSYTTTASYRLIQIDPRVLVTLPGARGEEKNIDQWRGDNITTSIGQNGFREESPPLIVVRPNGQAVIWEGNHRVRAAIAAGLPTIPVEVRYFGGSERIPGVWRPPGRDSDFAS